VLLIPVKVMSYRSSESEWQFCAADERPQEVLLPPDGLRRRPHGAVQFVHVVRAVVGQGAGFKIRPTVLAGVELRGIRRKEFQVQTPAAPQPLSKPAALVRPEPVPHHHQPSVQVAQEVAKKRNDLFLTNAEVHVEPQVLSQAPPAGRDRHPADGRHPAAVPHVGANDRRLSAQRPRASDQRMQQKARFIDENEVGVRAMRRLMRGQSRRIQRRMASSSRSLARHCGF
jgi:hypothetical protein